MGIPFYVASLLKTHKRIQQDVGNAALDVDVVGIDFNCFIHTYLESEHPIGSIVVALEHLLTNIVRAKKVYIAFDGLVPYAKIVQQRYRRFRKPDCASSFDKHQISPGTPYMRELADTLRVLFPHVLVSDTTERGEGEHKIFQWLRSLPTEERRNICIYGLDADLVLIALAQHALGSIVLLREQKDEGFSTFSINELKQALPLELDAYLRMCILCFGNDFMPSLAMFSLREDGYARALYYADKTNAHEDERKVLLKRAKESDRRIVAPDGHALETRFGLHLMDGVLNWEPVCYAFWKTFEWTLHYFKTSEVLDWDWVYPYAEAPLLQTLEDFAVPKSFVWSSPEPSYTIEDQLCFILPSESLRRAGLDPKYEDELYDEATETRHRWMKRFVWECDPYISCPWAHGQLTSVDEIHPPQAAIPRLVV
jgi:5'-3' exonuclease